MKPAEKLSTSLKELDEKIKVLLEEFIKENGDVIIKTEAHTYLSSGNFDIDDDRVYAHSISTITL